MLSPLLLSINWNPDPELFRLFGSIPIHYYGLLWVVGIILAGFIVQREYRDRRISDEKFAPLFFYCIVGITLGA
ncbi:prolipoprotein diacylglyceryl transferase family protein, partial [Bacteroides heparinolyticus]